MMGGSYPKEEYAAYKPTNPKDAVGIRKVCLSVLPIRVLYEVALGMLEGALKYGRHNFRVIGVRASVYYDATKRHLDDWWEGTDTDPDSQINHITKAICSLIVLRDAMIRGNWTDDRPPRSADGWMAEMNAKAAALIDKYPDPKRAYTQADLETADRLKDFMQVGQPNPTVEEAYRTFDPLKSVSGVSGITYPPIQQ